MKSKEKAENFDRLKVMVRVRPAVPRELESAEYRECFQISEDNTRIEIFESTVEREKFGNVQAFSLDRIFGPKASQAEVFHSACLPGVESAMQGFSAAVIAYGQTGSGKTYTMEGGPNEGMGLMMRAAERVLREAKDPVKVSYLQVYNENVTDLLGSEQNNLTIREDKRRGFFVEDLSEWSVSSVDEISALLARGRVQRATGATRANDVSSRSHAVFSLIVGNGKINLVDLAGSERVGVTGAKGARLEECKKINQSLSALSLVVYSLTDPGRGFVSYRDSKLTMILADCLNGESLTTFVTTISPSVECSAESISTLTFAKRAKKIPCKPRKNEAPEKSPNSLLESEVFRLREELKTRPSSMSYQKLLAENSRAFSALEEKETQLMKEREEKKNLLVKIEKSRGSSANPDPTTTPTNRDRQSADRFKDLLIQQKELLVETIAQIEEKDELILQLKEEVEEVDRAYAEAERLIDAKNKQIAQLKACLAIEKSGSEQLFRPNPHAIQRKLDRLFALIGSSDPDTLREELEGLRELVLAPKRETITVSSARPRQSKDIQTTKVSPAAKGIAAGVVRRSSEQSKHKGYAPDFSSSTRLITIAGSQGLIAQRVMKHL